MLLMTFKLFNIFKAFKHASVNFGDLIPDFTGLMEFIIKNLYIGHITYNVQLYTLELEHAHCDYPIVHQVMDDS